MTFYSKKMPEKEKIRYHESMSSVKKVSRKLPPFEYNSNGSLVESDDFSDKLAADSISPLRKMRKNRGFTLKQLSSVSGISASYLSRIEVRARRMNEEVIRRLCIVLKCAPGDLLNNLVPERDVEKAQPLSTAFEADLPLYTCVRQNDKMIMDIDGNKEWRFRPVELTAEQVAFALLIGDSSNAPKYREGDIVYVKPSKVPQIGNTVVAIMHTYEVELGYLKDQTSEKLILQSFDGASQKQIKMSELKKIYPVLMSVEKI